MLLNNAPRVGLMSGEDFRTQILERDTPAVLVSAASEWPATQAWTFDRLVHLFRDLRIPVRTSDDEHSLIFGHLKSEVPRRMMAFADYVAAIRSLPADGSRPPYAGSLDPIGDPAIAARMSGLLASCPFPEWIPRKGTDEYRIWIGAEGQKSTIHNDSYHNFNVQILGTKRFLLFSPDQHPHLYPEFIHQGLWSSPIDPGHPNLERYPDFEGVKGYSCELQPGDILFIPRFWWHSAEATSASLNINRWVFAERSTVSWWHQQPQVRAHVPFGALRDRLRTEFLGQDAKIQASRRQAFEALDYDLARLANVGH